MNWCAGFLCVGGLAMSAAQAGTVVHMSQRDLPQGKAHPSSVI